MTRLRAILPFRRVPTGILGLLSAGAAVLALAGSAPGGVARFEIVERTPFADGKSFGEAGPYERIVGRVFYEIDPALPQNQAIVDLAHAPRNARGNVEFSGDLFILAPRDLSKGNRALLYDVNNRGRKLALGMFNYGGGNDPKTEKDAGDGFLMRHGFTVVWSGWDGELLPGGDLMRLRCPVATDDGKPIVGPVRCELVTSEPLTRSIVIPWAGHGSYRPTAAGRSTATLTVRERPGDPRAVIPRDQWTLHVSETEDPSQLPKVEIEVPGGLKPGLIYELIYEAQDPIVQGVCFAGVRDLISAIKRGEGAGNPLVRDGKPVIERAHGFGVSQSGRFLRELLYSGFNQDEAGRRVFDGLIPHVSGSGLGSFNHRFAQPTRHASQHDHHDSVADRFPFTYGPMKDPLSGREDSLLRRSLESGTAPFILHTQSEAEYWTRSGSLSHTDPLGKVDAEIPPNVRVYLFGGTQHGPGPYPPGKGPGQTMENPGDYKPFLRGLLLALDRWAQGGPAAPPSVYPTIAAGTLVAWDRKSTGFPDIPGVRYPEVIQQPALLDFGRRWQTERIIDLLPPKAVGDYHVLTPKCGPDGNAIGCLSPPEVAVPTATYTGWNLRRADAGAENELVSLKGSYIPFAGTKAEREKTGDPRLSVEERYGTWDSYAKRLDAECRRLRDAGYITAEDAERLARLHAERARPQFLREAVSPNESRP